MTTRQSQNRSHRFSYLFNLVVTLWIVEFINALVNHKFCRWGIYPRAAAGLVGIPLSPLLHTSLAHLALNTGPIIILGGLISLNSKRLFLSVSCLATLLGGMLLWIFGRPAYHVGASGLIFSYFGFLVSRGIFNQKIGPLIVSILTLFIYGSLIWGVLPTLTPVSWEGHLSGLVAGVFIAKRYQHT